MTEVMIGHYQIETEIGSGGMGTVYRGIDLHTQQLVAIKRLKPEALQDDPLLLERFRREADALRQLNHPNIVHVFDTFEDELHHYIVMEYISGGSLRQLLDHDKQLPLNQTIRIALDIADALTRAHRRQLRFSKRHRRPRTERAGGEGARVA